MNNYWIIDDCNTKFDTLRDAKNHTTFWTKKELEAYDGSAVMHIVGEEIVSICTMHVRNGRANFSKIFKVKENRVC